MLTFYKLFLISFIFISLFKFQDFDPSNCDWENNSDNCFALAQAEFDKEKAALDAEIADLQKQNDDVTTEINNEMNLVNQKVDELKKQMVDFQTEMDESFKNMTPTDLYAELEKDLAELENQGK